MDFTLQALIDQADAEGIEYTTEQGTLVLASDDRIGVSFYNGGYIAIAAWMQYRGYMDPPEPMEHELYVGTDARAAIAAAIDASQWDNQE